MTGGPRCHRCGTVLAPRDALRVHDGTAWCEPCAGAWFGAGGSITGRCAACDAPLALVVNHRVHDGEAWCEDCFPRHFFTCECCNGVMPVALEVVSEALHAQICKACHYAWVSRDRDAERRWRAANP